MSNQADFDAAIADINAKLDAVNEAVTAEAQQIADWIAANPSVDTSALQGVADRLTALAPSVEAIFEPAA